MCPPIDHKEMNSSRSSTGLWCLPACKKEGQQNIKEADM